MQSMAAMPLTRRLTACARKGFRRAGRDAGTGALNRTQELTVRETAAAFVALYVGAKKRVTGRRRHLNADLDRRLHWQPRIGLEAGMRATYAWFLAQNAASGCR
jgi:nucleoside-diphosphate-sugar epimerase